MGPRQTDRKQTDREPNDTDWLRRAIISMFYYPQSHLAQTLTLWQNHCDEISDQITMTKPCFRGQLVVVSWPGSKADAEVLNSFFA